MFEFGILETVRNNAFKAILAVFGLVLLVLAFAVASPLGAAKSALEGPSIPQMPAPEVATYVLDLSGSTNPTAQLDALGSGITDFMAGQALGNPFAKSPVAPRGLSIQFITKNSAQAPRILLVSAGAGNGLYTFIKNKGLNLEGAKQLWDGLINARNQIWQNTALTSSQASCTDQVIRMLGQQQLLPADLNTPAGIICQDAKQTNLALHKMKAFISHPDLSLGSDVQGAVMLGLQNLEAAKNEFPSAHLTLVVASDMVDEVTLSLPHRLARSDSKNSCSLATKDAKSQNTKYPGVDVVLVGDRNSNYGIPLLQNVDTYWSCYFTQIATNNIKQQSDLSGF